MQNQTTNKSHFDYSQLALVFVCAVLLVGITFFKSGFKFTLTPTKSATADSNKVLTYDEIKKQVEAKNQNSLDQALASIGEDEQEQLALLDPSTSGQVLGADTNTENLFPKAETIFNPDILSQINVKISKNNDIEAIKKYSSDILLLESYYESVVLIYNLNSDDPESLKKVTENSKLIIAGYTQIQVPEQLIEYHKLKMLYFLSLMKISQGLLDSANNDYISEYTTIFFSLIERIDKIQNEFLEKYKIAI